MTRSTTTDHRSAREGRPDEQARPRAVAGLDLRSLPLGPEDAFVLSRVDGAATPGEIALSTGLPLERVKQSLAKLAHLGAVAIDGEATSAGPAEKAPGTPASDPAASAPVEPEQPPVNTATSPGASEPPPYDPAELEEAADLSLERKRVILDTFYRLDRLDHYALLQVDRAADKKAIKSAYYELVSIFHPDKYYGKNLGSFRAKLDQLFQRITEAHDTLTRKKSRAEYDRYLESQQETRALDRMADPDTQRAKVAEIERQIEREARMGETPSTPAGAPTPPQPPPGPTTISSPRISRPSLSEDERRRALARKFRSSMPPAQRQSRSDLPTAGPSAPEAAARALRDRYDERVRQAREARIGRYLEQADTAQKSGNVIAEVNALRIAVSLAPEDRPLKDRFEETERRAAEQLSTQYLEQAQYEEKQGHFAAAAATYQRALRGRPSARLYERAAHCLLKADADLKRGSELAKKAVELAPNEPAYRITLARIYAKANMAQSALAELERARAENPSDDRVKDWIKRIKRGEI